MGTPAIQECMEDKLHTALGDTAARALLLELCLSRAVRQLRDCANVLDQCKPTTVSEAQNISKAKMRALDIVEQYRRIS